MLGGMEIEDREAHNRRLLIAGMQAIEIVKAILDGLGIDRKQNFKTGSEVVKAVLDRYEEAKNGRPRI